MVHFSVPKFRSFQTNLTTFSDQLVVLSISVHYCNSVSDSILS